MDELIDIYDENNCPMGVVEYKEVVHRKALWHRTIVLIAYTADGDILLRKNNFTEEDFLSLKNMAIMSHLKSGENRLDVAVEKIKQELNYEVQSEDLKLWLIKIFQKNYSESIKEREFRYIYFFKVNKKEIKTNLPELINKTYFLSIDELKKELGNNEEGDFVYKEKYWMDILNELSKTVI